MQPEPPGPDSSESEWAQSAHPGIIVRRAKPNGAEQVKELPLDRDLQAVMDWAAAEYSDPARPLTPREPPLPPTASQLNSRFRHKT